MVVSITFDSPIEFCVTIRYMEYVNTIESKLIFIRGLGEFGDITENCKFYCPMELVYLLENLKTEIGDRIKIEYLGNRKNIKQFYVSKENMIDNKKLNDY